MLAHPPSASWQRHTVTYSPQPITLARANSRVAIHLHDNGNGESRDKSTIDHSGIKPYSLLQRSTALMSQCNEEIRGKMYPHRQFRIAGMIGILGGTLLAPMGVSYATSADSDSDSAILRLSTENEKKILKIAKNDSALKSIVKGSGFTVLEVGPWTSEEGNTLIGAVAKIRLAESLTTKGSWPGVNAASNAAHYSKGTHRLAVSGITDLTILVDLQKGQVVSVEPVEESSTPEAENPSSADSLRVASKVASISGTITPLDDARVSPPVPGADGEVTP